MMTGEVEATTLTEPYVTLAEKSGCRIVCLGHSSTAPRWRPTASMPRPMPPSPAPCARRCGASTPTSAAYLHYFIDYHKAKDPEIGTLTVDDLRASRIVVCDPAPIPLDEMQRTYDWLKSWGMLEETSSPLDLVNLHIQQQAHAAE